MSSSDIIKFLEEATGPSHELSVSALEASGLYVFEKRGRDNKKWLYPLSTGYRVDPSFVYNRNFHVTASIDAAIALVERMLPGWKIEIGIADDAICVLYSRDYSVRESVFGPTGQSKTVPIAILIALFRALEAKDQAA